MANLSISQNENNDQSDFIYGNDGHAGLSQRKAAELLGVSHKSNQKILEYGDLFDSQRIEIIAQKGFRGGDLTDLAGHFADSYRTKAETKKRCIKYLQQSSAFGGQVVIDRLAGIPEQNYTPTPEPQSTLFKSTDEAIDRVTQTLIQAGISEPIAMSFKLTQYAKRDTGNIALYEEAKRLIGSSAEIPDPLYSPTEIGKKLADILGIEKPLSAQKVNQALLEAGLQLAKIEEKQKDGKLISKTVYHLTEKGRQFGQMITDTARGHGKTVFSIRWLDTVVEDLTGRLSY